MKRPENYKYHIQWPFRPHMPHTIETLCKKSINDETNLCKYDPLQKIFYIKSYGKLYKLEGPRVCKNCAKQAKMRFMPL
jgi:hypothetical protein